jgi:hypothetical protein
LRCSGGTRCRDGWLFGRVSTYINPAPAFPASSSHDARGSPWAALVTATGEVELGGCDGGRDQGCKCELSNPALTTDAKLGATFYDSQRVFYNIRDYTGANSWDTCDQNAQAIYRDSYVLRNNGRVPGYWDYG